MLRRFSNFPPAGVLAGLWLVMVCACGCDPAPSARTESRELQFVNDSTGRRVGLPGHPKRVLSLCTTVTDTMLRLGAGAQLAGIDEYSRVVPGASNLVVLGRGGAISREQVLARGIDLAFVWAFQDEAVRLLEDLAVPVVRIRCGRAAELPGAIRLVGQCVARAEAASLMADEVAAGFRSLAPVPPGSGPRVYLELYGAYKTVGRDSFMNDLLEMAGATNIAVEIKGGGPLSAEHLIQADPDVILFVNGFATAAGIASRSGLEKLSAVRHRHLLEIDRYWLVAGAGAPEAARRLRETLARFVPPSP